MFGKISQRMGTKPIKTLFRIDGVFFLVVSLHTLSHLVVHKVVFPVGSAINKDWEVSVCFERGGKVAASPDSHFQQMADGSFEAEYDKVSL